MHARTRGGAGDGNQEAKGKEGPMNTRRHDKAAEF